jgi:hypothetical protein
MCRPRQWYRRWQALRNLIRLRREDFSRAGIAARILSLRPGLKPFEMKTILYWLLQSAKNGRRRE